jgi:S-formylglutathione hydrolase FrmB
MARAALGKEPEWQSEMQRIYGDPSRVKGSKNDLFRLAKKVAASNGPKPRLYQWCGTEDFLYKSNVRFSRHAQKLGLELRYEESPGTHEWKYWDEQIQIVLEWLDLKKLPVSLDNQP